MSSDMEGHVLVSDTVLMDRDGSVEDRGEKAYLELGNILHRADKNTKSKS